MAGSSPAMESYARKLLSLNLPKLAPLAYGCFSLLGNGNKSRVQGSADSHQIWRCGGNDARSAMTPMRKLYVFALLASAE